MNKKFRIRVLVPLTGLDERVLDNRRKMLDQFKGPRTEIEFAVIGSGPSSIESAYDEAYGAQDTLREVVRAEQEGVDAVIIWCAADANLEPARELVHIPVVGPASASYHLASLLADRFMVLTVLSHLAPLTRRLVEVAGLGRKLTSVRAIDIPVLDMEHAEDELFNRAVQQAEAAVAEEGAEAIVLGCMGMINLSERLAAHFRERGSPIPVINPGFASLKMAETLAVLGLSHSKLTYPTPRKVEGLEGSWPVPVSS